MQGKNYLIRNMAGMVKRKVKGAGIMSNQLIGFPGHGRPMNL